MKEYKVAGIDCILCRQETSGDDIAGLHVKLLYRLKFEFNAKGFYWSINHSWRSN